MHRFNCRLAVLAVALTTVSPSFASADTHEAIDKLQGQLQEVVNSIPTQIKAQAKATNEALTSFQTKTRQKIAAMEAQLHSLQSSMVKDPSKPKPSARIKRLQRCVRTPKRRSMRCTKTFKTSPTKADITTRSG